MTRGSVNLSGVKTPQPAFLNLNGTVIFWKPPKSSYGSSYRANQSSRPDFSTSYGTPRQNYASSGAYRTENRFTTNYSSTSR